MSTRQMSHQYSAPIHTMPQSGADLFGFQHRREIERMKVQAAIEKEIAAHQEQLAEKLRNNSTVVKAAEAAGIPVDTYIKELAGGATKNAQQAQKNDYMGLMNAGTALNPDLNPNILKANQIGANIRATGMNPDKVGGTARIGEVSTTPDIPGVGMNTLIGGTTRQTPIMYGGFKDPKTGITMNEHMGERNEMLPGKIIPSRVNPSELPPNPAGQFDNSNPDVPYPMMMGPSFTQPKGGITTTGDSPLFQQESSPRAISPYPANSIGKSGQLPTGSDGDPGKLIMLLRTLFGNQMGGGQPSAPGVPLQTMPFMGY